jgi:hypothetical protein
VWNMVSRPKGKIKYEGQSKKVPGILWRRRFGAPWVPTAWTECYWSCPRARFAEVALCDWFCTTIFIRNLMMKTHSEQKSPKYNYTHLPVSSSYAASISFIVSRAPIWGGGGVRILGVRRIILPLLPLPLLGVRMATLCQLVLTRV